MGPAMSDAESEYTLKHLYNPKDLERHIAIAVSGMIEDGSFKQREQPIDQRPIESTKCASHENHSAVSSDASGALCNQRKQKSSNHSCSRQSQVIVSMDQREPPQRKIGPTRQVELAERYRDSLIEEEYDAHTQAAQIDWNLLDAAESFDGIAPSSESASRKSSSELFTSASTVPTDPEIYDML